MNGNNAFRARRRTASLAASAALALAVFGSAPGAAHAQGFGGAGPGFGRGFGGPGGGRNASPLQSNPMGLLQRPEVQTHLRLTVQQKNQIAELQGQSRDMMRQRMGQVFRNQGQQQGGGDQNPRNLSREERQQRMAEIRPQIEAAMNAYQGELSEKMKAILTPEQAARLRQLDLQRRGILSLADPKVAEEIKLSPEHRTQIAQIVTAWQQETGETMRAAFEQARQNNQFPDFESRLSPTRQKLDRSKKAAEAQVEALLSAEEKAAWEAAIGPKFAFRADPPAQPRQQRPGFGGNNRGGNNRGGGRQGGFGAPGGAFPG